MNEIYGHQWASQQGDDPNDTWIRGLSEVTLQQYGVGLRALLDRAETWPPNLVEFRQICLGSDPGSWERQCHKEYRLERQLIDMTRKDRNQEAGKQALAELRGMLGGAT